MRQTKDLILLQKWNSSVTVMFRSALYDSVCGPMMVNYEIKNGAAISDGGLITVNKQGSPLSPARFAPRQGDSIYREVEEFVNAYIKHEHFKPVMWWTKERCAYAGCPVRDEEAPEMTLCTNKYNHVYVDVYDRGYLLEKSLSGPFEEHMMSADEINEKIGVKRVGESGEYEDSGIRYAGLSQVGVMLYDMSESRTYKSWRLKKLFE